MKARLAIQNRHLAESAVRRAPEVTPVPLIGVPADPPSVQYNSVGARLFRAASTRMSRNRRIREALFQLQVRDDRTANRQLATETPRKTHEV